MSWPRWYILDGKEPRAVAWEQYVAWAHACDGARRVAEDYVGDVHISTVFLGLDHNHFGNGPPLLFETMIFGGKHNEFQARTSTWDAAEQQHRVALALVRPAVILPFKRRETS